MITSYFLNIFGTFLTLAFSTVGVLTNTLVNWFPSFRSALTYFTPMWRMFNLYLPVDTLVAVMVLIINIEIVLLLVNVTDWIYNKIRGSG